jgi:hypothetical protein
MGPERKKELYGELVRVLKECQSFGYFPSYFRNDLANSDPAELCMRYTLNPPTEGFLRLQTEGRLDLAVENVVWQFRDSFPRDVTQKARTRLHEFGFDVTTQRQMPPRAHA